jgi:SHS2 domain-containing protein
MSRPDRGHRSVPHTADLRIEAYGPTREACLAEAVAALVESFADTAGARPTRTLVSDLVAGTDADLLAAVLDEVIYVLDTQGAVVLGLHTERHPGGLRVHFPVASVHDVNIVGAIPKAVALSGLHCSSTSQHWSCAVTVDV